MAHRPLNKAEIEEGVRAEVLDLPDELRGYFARVAVDVREATGGKSPNRTLFVVAKSGDRAIFYDDVEDEFGIGTIDGDERLKDNRPIGELRSALLALRNG